MLKLSDIFRINGIAFFIIIVQNSFDQKGLPLPTKKKRPYSVYYISDIKKRALFFNFCTKMHPSHVALPLMSAFFLWLAKSLYISRVLNYFHLHQALAHADFTGAVFT